MCKQSTTTSKPGSTEHEKAEALQSALEKVQEGKIPVMSRERHIPRKQQAALARELFKRLGLRGVSVTTPNYSMAHSVDVSYPKLQIHCHDMWPHNWEVSDRTEETRCPTCKENWKMHEKIAEILARAFPNHDDRSDSMTDYFDFKWSIS